jgi:hypothetical protein
MLNIFKTYHGKIMASTLFSYDFNINDWGFKKQLENELSDISAFKIRYKT